MQNGKEFEILAKSIYEKLSPGSIVKQNDKLWGYDSETFREIDVSITGYVGPTKIVVIIQCKDHNKILDIKYVDDLYGVMQDVKAHKGILIGRKGFSKTAYRSARRRGIDLCLLHDADNRNWQLDLQIPIIVELIEPLYSISYEVYLEQGNTINTKPNEIEVSGINLFDVFTNDWNKGNLNTDNGEHLYNININNPAIITLQGEKKQIENLQVKYEIVKKYKFGFVSEIPKLKAVKETITNKIDLLFRYEDMASAIENFQIVHDIDEYKDKEIIHVLSIPQIKSETSKFTSSVKYLGK